MELRSKLHHIAMDYLNCDEDAQDALQDTWLRLKQKDNVADGFEAKNKLVHVLRNVCIDRLRKARTQPMDEFKTPSAPLYEMETEDLKQLENLLQKGLTPLQQQIFDLVTHKGYEYDQIAKELSLSPEAVRMNMSRARKKIRETYNKLNV